MPFTEEFYQIVNELRLIASAGLKFATAAHEIERHRRVRAAAARLLAAVEGRPSDEVLAHFEGDLFEQRVSPLSTVDAVVMRDEHVLLIKRHDNGLWALPGGLVEVNQTLAEATLRELYEETGLCGHIVKLLGIFDSYLWDSRDKVHIHHAIFLVDGGQDEPKITREATQVGFFSEDNLPTLSPGHHLRVPFIFKLLRGKAPVPYFDPADKLEGCD